MSMKNNLSKDNVFIKPYEEILTHNLKNNLSKAEHYFDL